jgi:1,4-alpha-glucan branching enzyme
MASNQEPGMPDGYLCLVLHAHLPFVRHPEHDDFLEEDWLYEAITETYIPLLEMLERLDRDGVEYRLTMSVTPPLANMLGDALLQGRYVRHLDNLIALADKEVRRTEWLPEFHPLALMYHHQFVRSRQTFVDKYQGNLLRGFRRFMETGRLELITCAATHGFMPLMNHNRNAMRAQIEVGAREHERCFGRRPAGIWLPECGYIEGVDELLRDAGIRYFFTDSHGVLFASPRPKFGVFAPIVCPASGVVVLGRDWESSKQVWSAQEGYPGDYTYREFYRDVAFDLDYEYVRPHLHSIGVRTQLGIKYYRITGPTDAKEPYDAHAARDRAADHAGNFMFNRAKQVEWLYGVMGREPLVVAPYDAELFGHWWFEGPQFLEFLFRKLHFDQDHVKPITVPQYLDRFPVLQQSQPTLSSWGHKGYCEVWLNGNNDWIYRHLHEAADRMVSLARRFPEPDLLQRRALNQAARELLLAQSSDWAFILKTGTSPEYAIKRTADHLNNFLGLESQLSNGGVDEAWLGSLEYRNNAFPGIDYRVYV